MEFETLTCIAVDRFLDGERTEHIPIDKYKLYAQYGEAGKWVHDANRTALSLLREIMRARPKMFAAVDSDTCFFQGQSVHSSLRSVSVAEGLDPQLAVNMSRKVFAVRAKLHKTKDLRTPAC